MSSLSKTEALELITPVVDDEVTPQQRASFMECLEAYPEVARQYRSALTVKQLIRSRCPREKAPPLLVERIRNLLTDASSGRSGPKG